MKSFISTLSLAAFFLSAAPALASVVSALMHERQSAITVVFPVSARAMDQKGCETANLSSYGFDAALFDARCLTAEDVQSAFLLDTAKQDGVRDILLSEIVNQ